MSAPLAPIPQTDPLIDRRQHMGDRWYRWLSDFVSRSLLGILIAGTPVHRTAIASSIGTTTAFTPTLPGTYRVTWGVQETTAATVNSSLTVTIGWKDAVNSVAQSEAFTAITGNTTGTHGSGSITIRPATSQPITYATTYVSNGATSMVYGIDVVVEQLT